MSSIERKGLGVPIVLLGTLWGVFGLILQVFELLNERRDAILAMQVGRDEDIGWKNLLWNDWIWLWVGTCFFLVTVAGILWNIPKFCYEDKDVPDQVISHTTNACRISATLLAFAALGFLVGGTLDFIAMLRQA